MTTTTTVIEFVINAGVKSAEEIFNFVMDKKNGVTVPVLEEGLVELMVAFKKKDTKDVKASLFARAMEMSLMTTYIPEAHCKGCGKFHEQFSDAYYVGYCADCEPHFCKTCDTQVEEALSYDMCQSCFIEANKQPAAGETPVAEETTQNPKEELPMKTQDKKIIITDLPVAGKRLPSPNVSTRRDLGIYHEAGSHKNNAPLNDMLSKVNSAKDAYVRNVGENAVVVEGITFYDQRRIRSHKVKSNGSTLRIVGEVTVRMPEGYAQIKIWNQQKLNSKGQLGAPEFIDFVGYDINLASSRYNMRRPLATGTGLVSLSIIEFVDKDGTVSPLSVSLPTEKGKDGTRYHIFQTNDARYTKTKNAEEPDMPLYVRDNNENFNAQVSAFVQMYANEFVQADPRNHHGFDKKSCTNMVRFGTKDGVMDDEHMESLKTRVILEQPDVMQLAQVGSEQPNTYCMVKNEWLDMEAVEILNDAEKLDRQGAVGLDEEGTERYQRHDEITISGQLVKRNTVREEVIKKNCSTCPFYCGNSPKADSQVAKERTEQREAGLSDYVSPFYREKPKAKAQAIQSLVVRPDGKEDWITEYPHNVLDMDNVIDLKGFRVKSAGMTVYGSDAVMGMVDPTYLVPTEEYDARHAHVMKQINRIFYAAFNLDKLDEAQAALIFELAENPPADLTEDEAKRWENATEWLAKSLVWAQEREAARNIRPMENMFFAGYREGAEILDVMDIMGRTKDRAAEGTLGWGLGYDDLYAEEFVRYLDEIAMDIVYEVILQGKQYCVVGEENRDMMLAAGALQEMLQRELNWSFVNGVRRDANPKKALDELKVAPVVKAYIQSVCNIEA